MHRWWHLAGVSKADDHMFEATQHGLSEDSQPFQTNPAGNSRDLAQPIYTGEGEYKTAATDTDARELERQCEGARAEITRDADGPADLSL